MLSCVHGRATADARRVGTRRRIAVVLIAVTAAAAALIPAAPASASSLQIYIYKVTFKGSGTFTHTDGPVSVHASFKWDVTIPSLLLLPKQFSTKPSGSSPLRAAGEGFGKRKDSAFTGHWDASVSGNPPCHGSGGFKPTWPPVAEAFINPLVRGGYLVDVYPSFNGEPLTEKPTGATDCADIGGPGGMDFWHDWPANEGVGDRLSSGIPFGGTVSLRPAKEGKVVEEVKVQSEELPHPTCSCTYSWSGKITLTRTSPKAKR